MALVIQAEQRQVTSRGKLSDLRKIDRKIPAVVFGHGQESRLVSFDYAVFEKIFADAGTSSLVDVAVEGSKTPLKVVISAVQRDSVSDKIIHVDMHQVRMDEKLRVTVPLVIVGEAPAVKNLGADLIVGMNSVTIECLPSDLLHSIEVDVSQLDKLDASIHVGDIVVPKGVLITDDPKNSVVSVLAPRVHEEVVETPIDVAAIPVAGAEEKAKEAAELEAQKAESK